MHAEDEAPHEAQEDLIGLDPEVEPALDATHPARPTLPHAALVAAGGATGTLARDLLLRASPSVPTAFPWMLASLNLLGAAALGLLVARVLDPRPSSLGARLFLATGLLGGFTTYSSLVSAAIVSTHHGRAALGAATLLGTLVAGVAAAWAGGRLRARGGP